MLLVLSDEADEEDDSGCGWLAGWLPNRKSVEEKHRPKLSCAKGVPEENPQEMPAGRLSS